MFQIPITTSTQDCHPRPRKGKAEQFDGEEGRVPMSVSEPLPAPAALRVRTKTTSMVSEGTQTDLPDIQVSTDSPTDSHADSSSPQSTFGERTDHFRQHHLQKPSTSLGNVPADSLLTPPQADLPLRPMTPQADLYHGQTSENFGMTFETRPATNWRNGNKPTSCDNKYEDHKHRIMMTWLERRGTV
jgi:hypothetical protein